MGPVTRARSTSRPTTINSSIETGKTAASRKTTKGSGRGRKPVEKNVSTEPVAEPKRKIGRGRGRAPKEVTKNEPEVIEKEKEPEVPDLDLDDDLDEPKALVIEEKPKPAPRRGRKPTTKSVKETPIEHETDIDDVPKAKRARKASKKDEEIREEPITKVEPKKSNRGRKPKNIPKTTDSKQIEDAEEKEEHNAIVEDDNISKDNDEAVQTDSKSEHELANKLDTEPETSDTKSENVIEESNVEPDEDKTEQDFKEPEAKKPARGRAAKVKAPRGRGRPTKKASPVTTKEDDLNDSAEVIEKVLVSEEEPVQTMEVDSESNIESVSSIQKVIYNKKVTGKAVIQKGTIEFELTSNNSLYLDANKDVAMVVEKLKFETEQSFEKEKVGEQEALEDKEEESLVTDDSFNPITTTFVSSPSTSTNGNGENVLNSTIDNFTRKRKAEDLEETEKKTKRLAPSVAGRVFVFGDDISGALGLGEIGSNKTRPFPLPLELMISGIFSLSQHNVILTEDGRVYTFGCNDECSLGRVTSTEDDPEIAEATPTEVVLKQKIVTAGTGDSHTAVLSDQNTVYYWGAFRDSNGCIGLSVDQRSPSVVPISLEGKYDDIASGGNFLLLLTREGRVYSLGNGERGELGRLSEDELKFDKQNPQPYFTPHEIKFDSDLPCERIWAGEFAGFARLSDGKVYAWGLNNYSQLGFAPPSQDQNDLCVLKPKEIDFFNESGIKVEKITNGQHHSLALDSQGHVYSFGRADYGRLGHGTVSGDALEPKLIEALKDKKIVDISCGTCSSFAVTEDGDLYSWGMGSAVLGLGVDDDVEVPTKVTSKHLQNKKVLRVAAGSQHCLIIVAENK